jgi:hypothetical protein
LLNGYQNKGASESPYTSRITLSNIPYSNYDLVVYFSADGAGRLGSVSDGMTTNFFSTMGTAAIAGTNAVFIQTTETNGVNHPLGDYAILKGLTASSKTIDVTIPDFGGIAGFQLAQSVIPLTTNYTLQEASTLQTPVTWQPSALVVSSNNGIFSVSIPAINRTRFFRLIGNPSATTNGNYIPNGLVGYWKFNDGSGTNAVDVSGRSRNVSLVGSPAWGSNYVTFNGTTQYGDAGSNTLTGLDKQDKTICAWVNKLGSSQKGIVDKSYAVGGVGYGGWGLWVQSNAKLTWVVQDSQVINDSGAAGLVLGSWTFVALTWRNASQRADFYMNGILNSTIINGAAIENASGPADLLVGNIRNNLSGGTYAFDGAIREVGIYDRVLSPAEIKANFLATELTTNVAIPSILYYKMTEHAQSNPPVYLADGSTHGGTTGAVQSGYTVQWVTNQAMIDQSAVHFNGVSTFIDTSNSVLFNFTTNSFTVNLWLLPLTANGYVMANGTTLQNGWFMSVGGSYQLIFGSDTPGNETSISTASSVSGWPSIFNMITVVRNGTNTPLIYVNGALTATVGSFANPAPSSTSLIFGKTTDGAHYLDGDLWQPQIWNTALSPTDISNLYFNQVSGLPWP